MIERERKAEKAGEEPTKGELPPRPPPIYKIVKDKEENEKIDFYPKPKQEKQEKQPIQAKTFYASFKDQLT